MGNIIDGSNVIVKFGTDGSEAPIACSTSCTVNIDQEIREVACKNPSASPDVGWTGGTPGKKSWSMTIDALYVMNVEGGYTSWAAAVQAIIDATMVSVVFEATDPDAVGGEVSTYTLTGHAIVSNTSLTAAAAEDSTFSITLTGHGGLTPASTQVPTV